MNLVLDDAEEVYVEKAGKEVKPRQDLGQSAFLSVSLRLDIGLVTGMSVGNKATFEPFLPERSAGKRQMGKRGAVIQRLTIVVDLEEYGLCECGSRLTRLGRILLKGDNITLIQAVGA